ncbi:MAG: esterase [Frankiales bacterium]|nr:esterase [Frankiales bacterium]
MGQRVVTAAVPTTPAAPPQHRVRTVVGALVVALLLVWGVNGFQEYRSVATAREYWLSPRGEAGGIVYVALGDSTAQGVGASRPERGYVGRLADDLRRRTRSSVLVVNLSSSGATVSDVLAEQVPRLRALDADVVTVAVRGNDVRSYDAAAFPDQVEKLAGALPAGAFVADAPWFMHGKWERQARLASAALTRSASAHGLHVVPLHDTLEARGWTSMLTDFAPDWFHPNDRGHRVWAEAFWTSMSPSILSSG